MENTKFRISIVGISEAICCCTNDMPVGNCMLNVHLLGRTISTRWSGSRIKKQESNITEIMSLD